MSRDSLLALGGGVASAIFYLSVKTGTPGAILLAYLAPLPLFLVGLARGWPAAAVAGLLAAIAVMAGASAAAAALFVVLAAGPALLVIRQALLSRPGAAPGALEWYPPGLLLGWLTGYGLAALGAAAIYHGGTPDGLDGAARDFLDATVRRIAAVPPDARLRPMLDALARYLPGMMASVWLVVTVANAILAQGALARFGWNRRPLLPLADLTLPRWMAAAFAVALLAAFAPGGLGTVGRNAAVILSVPFFFLGLAVIHALSARLAGRRFLLVVLYLMLVLFGWPAILVVGLGIIEQWALLRRRFAGPRPDREDE